MKLYYRRCLRGLFMVFIFSQYLSLYCQQELRGIVLDAVTKKPLEAVAVYLNGTTKGVITNNNGRFYLETNSASNEPLIISYLGYENKTIEQSRIQDKNNIVVYLKEQLEPLDPVYLSNDSWSRQKKLAYFKRYFIGSGNIQNTCKILNEKDIKLFYKLSENKLYPSAYVPIRIKNDFLAYDISYDLISFEILFKEGNNESPEVKSVFFMGSSFYTDKIETKPDPEHYLVRRDEAYLGSFLHFMRSIATKKLRKNKFKLFYQGKKIRPKKCFTVEVENGFANVTTNKNQITILYDSSKFSQMLFNHKLTSFSIDGYGNYRPVRLFRFAGYMGGLKLGKMLPLDYGL
ncbi:carboxypeptidase-like regulatory domain-containing protein [Aquimarina sp. SS2-1]|uniref:carboxypeptidase-like regulatory domain-containing protein n=1 Tax=Aquimarina besae TaxID=3342247 RepID=UPI00366E99D7